MTKSELCMEPQECAASRAAGGLSGPPAVAREARWVTYHECHKGAVNLF